MVVKLEQIDDLRSIINLLTFDNNYPEKLFGKANNTYFRCWLLTSVERD